MSEHQRVPMSQKQNPELLENTLLSALISRIADVILQARGHVRQSVNQAMMASYWEIGHLIVERRNNPRHSQGRRPVAIHTALQIAPTFQETEPLPGLLRRCAPRNDEAGGQESNMKPYPFESHPLKLQADEEDRCAISF
ncbi:MAG: hypothetical protein LBF93_10710 [Zoogloeaceae bacterium]|nr:hypothetical protein [Zoogloeaceae bacterium]